MSTDAPTQPKTAAEAFAEAGLDINDVKAQENRMRAAGAEDRARITAQAAKKVETTMKPAMVRKCGKCGASLPEGQFFICEKCAEKNEDAERAAKAKPKAVVSEHIGHDFPERHRGELQTYEGPAIDCGNAHMEKIMSAKGSMILLFGHSGTGKTGLATWWEWRRLHTTKKHGQFFTLQELYSRVKECWHKERKQSEHEFVTEFCKCPYTVIDEIDEGKGTDWEMSTFFDILNRIYNACGTVVLISNLDVEELKARYSKKLLERISEAGGLVHCNWPSYRAKKITAKSMPKK